MVDIVLPQHAAALRELDQPFFYGSTWNFMRDELPRLSNFSPIREIVLSLSHAAC